MRGHQSLLRMYSSVHRLPYIYATIKWGTGGGGVEHDQILDPLKYQILYRYQTTQKINIRYHNKNQMSYNIITADMDEKQENVVKLYTYYLCLLAFNRRP